MSATNDFLQFATNVGANVESQSDYAADSNRTLGNQPGIASSAFINKALRQANFVTSLMAQYISNATGTNMQDNTNGTQFLQQMAAAFQELNPTVNIYTSGSGLYKLPYVFFIATGSATSGATYTNNGNTFTVVNTISSGNQLVAASDGGPQASGTLTKATGTGDATITFYAVRTPLSLKVRMVGGGGGGGGGTSPGGQGSAGESGAGGGYVEHLYTSLAGSYSYAVGAAGAGATAGNNAGGNGGNTTFGSLTAGGGTGGTGSASTAGTANTPSSGPGAAGGSATGGGILNVVGGSGAPGMIFSGTQAVCNSGGISEFSPGSIPNHGTPSSTRAGDAGVGYGGGGGGGVSFSGNVAGGAGTAGLIIVQANY